MIFFLRLLVWPVEAAIGWLIASAGAYWLLSFVWFPAATIEPLAALIAQGDLAAAFAWFGSDRVLLLSAVIGAAVMIQILVAICLLFVSVIQELETDDYAKSFTAGNFAKSF